MSALMYNQRMKFALPLTLAALLFAAPAFAANGDVQACGDTYKAKLDTDPENHFCDIYSRQFAYREEALKFKKMLKEYYIIYLFYKFEKKITK